MSSVEDVSFATNINSVLIKLGNQGRNSDWMEQLDKQFIFPKMSVVVRKTQAQDEPFYSYWPTLIFTRKAPKARCKTWSPKELSPRISHIKVVLTWAATEPRKHKMKKEIWCPSYENKLKETKPSIKVVQTPHLSRTHNLSILEHWIFSLILLIYTVNLGLKAFKENRTSKLKSREKITEDKKLTCNSPKML